MSVAFYTDSLFRRHENAPGHPECPGRLQAITDAVDDAGLVPRLQWPRAVDADDDQLRRAHTRDYLLFLADQSPVSGSYRLDPDTAMNRHSLAAARRAAGAVTTAVEAVLAGTAGRAFCAVRPPGHHATTDYAMGFCLLNNVAIAARHAIAARGLRRVAIVDFDVHHGNGTEAIIGGDNRIRLYSAYQHPFYPFSDPDEAPDNTVHTPLPAGTDGKRWRAAIERDWWPALDAFAPELILVSAGFDGHADDPLAQWLLAEGDYRWVTDGIVALANDHCGGRVVSTLEGGYDADALGRSVVAHLQGLLAD